MIDREAFVSRLILEAETPLERAAVTELQIAGLELERLRAIVRDLAALDVIDGEYLNCVLCPSPRGKWDLTQQRITTEHDPGCPWLRATQEAETPK